MKKYLTRLCAAATKKASLTAMSAAAFVLALAVAAGPGMFHG